MKMAYRFNRGKRIRPNCTLCNENDATILHPKRILRRKPKIHIQVVYEEICSKCSNSIKKIKKYGTSSIAVKSFNKQTWIDRLRLNPLNNLDKLRKSGIIV